MSWRWGWGAGGALILILWLPLAGAQPAAAQQPQPRRPPPALERVLPPAARAAEAGQERGAEDEPELTPREQALERLRSQAPVGVQAPPDTVGRERDADRFAPARGGRRGAPAASGPVTDVPADSVLEALLGLSGYTATEYQGARVTFRADTGALALEGPAEVTRTGQRLMADSLLVYDRGPGVICGYGNPVLSGGTMGAPVVSDQLCYDLHRRVGLAAGARTEFMESGNWFVHGDSVYTVGNDRVYIHSAHFTSCDLEVPHFHFAAGEVKMVHNDLLVARNVTLNFADVPVFWLPFLVQNLREGRRSGLLTPSFSANDIVRNSTGYRRQIQDVGFYWAMNDHMGSELAFDWFSGTWTALRGNFQYRLVERFLQGSVDLKHYWREEGGRELTLVSSNSWDVDERTSLRADMRYASSSDFVARRSFDPLELTRSIDSNGGLTRRFDWGNLTLSGQRRQFLTEERVERTLPSLSVNLNPVTLFAAPSAEAGWYNNVTWNASASGSLREVSVDEFRPGPQYRDARTGEASFNSAFTLGRLSWRQEVRGSDGVLQPKPELRDTLDVVRDTALARDHEQRLDWRTSLNFQQRLIGTSTITPGLTVAGGSARSLRTEGEMVEQPLRLDFSTDLKADVYGFWPGVGPFERVRHRLQPTIGYSYSPAPTVTDRQREVFGVREVQERNRVRVGLNQTFEARFMPTEAESERQDRAAAALDAGEELEAEATATGPRRLPQPRRMMLLSLNTSALVYDFVQARDGYGLETTTIENSLSSDLLRGLTVGFSHDLFERHALPEGAPPGTQAERTLAPHLNRLNASFAVSSDSWLFRRLGLSGGETAAAPPLPEEPEAARELDPVGVTRRQADMGMSGRHGGLGQAHAMTGGSGGWNASMNYTLLRPRAGGAGRGLEANQMITGNVSFRPTDNWGVSWQTGYSITEGEFSDHRLAFMRNLHEWEASFNFVKVQNGNLSFQFLVRLRDHPDLKLDYEQRNDRFRNGGNQGPRF
jgi:hypothetical protein